METTRNSEITEGMLRAAVVYAALRERERCARVCERMEVEAQSWEEVGPWLATYCADAIRRGDAE